MVTNLDTVDSFKETEDKLMKRGMGEMGSDEDELTGSDEDDGSDDDNDLTPWEKYIMKRKKKQKEYRKQKKEKEMGGPRKRKGWY